MIKVQLNGVGRRFGNGLFERAKERIGRLRTVVRTGEDTTLDAGGTGGAGGAPEDPHRDTRARLKNNGTQFQS